MVWLEKALPHIRQQKFDELTPTPVAAEITQDGRNRNALMALRNTTGKTLTNVVIVLSVKDGEKALETHCYFVRDWPAEVVLWPDPFRVWRIPAGLPDLAQVK